jgi:hypothetical protein
MAAAQTLDGNNRLSNARSALRPRLRKSRPLSLCQWPVQIEVLKYFLFVVLVPLAVAAGVYYFSDHWMHLLSNSWQNLDAPTQRELVKVAPTAIAAMFGSIVAAVTSVIVVGLQRNANLQVETRKGEILSELEKKKNTLAGELDTKRQELQHELGITRREIDEQLSRLNEARAAVSEYRYLIQTMRLYGYKAEDIEPIHKKLIQLRDSFREPPELYQAWAIFYQRGYYLCERIKPLRSPASRRRVWAEQSQESPLSLGVEFGNSAEEVLGLLAEMRTQILSAQ